MLRSGSTAFGVGAELLWLMPPIGRYVGDDSAPLRSRFCLTPTGRSSGQVGSWQPERMERRLFTDVSLAWVSRTDDARQLFLLLLRRGFRNACRPAAINHR